jgi:hypothetical protein
MLISKNSLASGEPPEAGAMYSLMSEHSRAKRGAKA